MKKSINILFLVLLTTTLFSQEMVQTEYAYRHFTTQDFLPTNVDECIFQDSQGFLWIGTEHGVVRYDGVQAKEYLTNKWFPINRIEENENGDIVIYGYYFVYIVDAATGELRQTYRNTKLNFLVMCSPSLPRGYAIYTKRDMGKRAVFHLQNDTLAEFFQHPLLDKMYEGQSPYFDEKNGFFYIPTEDNRLSVVDLNGNVKKVFSNVEICRFIRSENELLAVGLHGAYSLTPTDIKLKYKYVLNGENGISETVLSKNGELFIHDDNTLYRFANGKLEKILDKINTPRALLFDSEGNLWFATRQGVYNFFKFDFKIYTIEEKKSALVSFTLPENKNTVWWGTESGTLIKNENEQFTKINYPKQYSDGFAYQPIAMEDALFFPTYSDILRYQNGQFKWLHLTPDIYYTTTFPLDENHFVIGGRNTLFILDKDGKKTGAITQNSTQRSIIYVARNDNHGNIWIGGFQGVIRFGARDTTFLLSDTTMNGLAIDRDPHGNVWLACENRIYRTRNNEIELFMKFENNLINNLVYMPDDLLVVSDTRKIYIIDANTKKMRSFDYSNGFAAIEPSWDTMTKDFNTNVWVSTQSASVAMFNPKSLFENKYSVNLHITQTEYSKNNVNWFPFNDFQKLQSSVGNLRFSYVGICFSNPKNVRYRYRLLGFQDEWSEPVSVNKLTFNNLPYGDYEFQIYAYCEDENSKTPVLSCRFSLTPAFWQTAWFLVAGIALLMLASAGVALYIQRRKNKVLLEKLRAEKELNELRISSIRLKAIPHFNANVLSAIEYYIANRTKEEAMRILEIYSDFTFKTLSDVDKAARPLSEELAYVKMYLDLEKVRFLDKFDFQINVEDGVDKNIQLPNMILHTYCENAVKHGLMPLKSGGLLTVNISQRDRIVCVSVEDNGVGRASAAQNSHLHSSKQGLAILNRQIEIYNSFNSEKINRQVEDLLKDGQSSGTRFMIEVPLQFTYIE